MTFRQFFTELKKELIGSSINRFYLVYFGAFGLGIFSQAPFLPLLAASIIGGIIGAYFNILFNWIKEPDVIYSPEEEKVIEQLMITKDMSRKNVLKAALRLYQRNTIRHNNGCTEIWYNKNHKKMDVQVGGPAVD